MYQFGSYIPSVNCSLKSWNQLHCSLQAFGLYCQQLPRLSLSTKSIHCYSYLLYFHTRLTLYCLRDTASKCCSSSVPLNPLAACDMAAVRGTDVFQCLKEFVMCQRVTKVIRSFHTLSNPIPHLGTPVVWSFRFWLYGVVIPEAQGYIVSSS